LQLAGLPVPEDVQGRSLLHLIWNENTPSATSYGEAYYPQYHFGWSRLLSLRNSDYKYIDAPKPELYDLKKDPGETVNLYSSQSQTAKQMKTELVKIAGEKRQDATMRPGAVDAEVHEKLAALGYVGAFVETSNEDPANLADPKDKIWLFNSIQDAQEASLDGKTEEAIAACKKVLELDPGIVDAQFLLGNEYFRSKQYPLALEAFQKTLKLKPDYDAAIVNLANTYRRMGKMQEALAGFQHFLQKKPDNAQILYLIGELYLSMDQPEDALNYFQKAIAAEPDTSWINNGIGAVYYKQKDYTRAEQYFRKALELNPDTAMAHFNLAQLFEKRGQMDRAVEEYKAELDVAPENVKAHFNLGRYYMKEGQMDSGIQHMKSAVEAEPEFAIGHLFLAQALIEKGDLIKAKEHAEKGLALNPSQEYRPLGHFVLADIYNRQGLYDLERQELQKAKAL
jgi:tetratricopeptide (TPR) repeat protein